MKITNTTPVLLLLSVLLIPAFTHAAMYEYVNTNNALQTVSANSPAQAFASASDIESTSGVMLLPSVLNDSLSSGDTVYEYVNTSGTLSTINAQSPTQAMSEATNIAPTSGVMAL